LYKKGKNSEDIDAAATVVPNKRLIFNKQEENLDYNRIINDEAAKTIHKNHKNNNTFIFENLENKIQGGSKNESPNNKIQVNINNNIYNNINIINKRDDKIIIVNDTVNTGIKSNNGSNNKEKINDFIMDSSKNKYNNNINNIDNNINDQVPNSNRKSRDNEHYKNELQKRIETLKTHLNTSQVYTNIPNKEEQENERIRLGIKCIKY